jgi:hypothetical protein
MVKTKPKKKKNKQIQPIKFELHNSEWQIAFLDKVLDLDGETVLDGGCQEDIRLIELGTYLDPIKATNTLWHELGHACIKDIEDLIPEKLQEVILNTFATNLAALSKQPQLRKLFIGKFKIPKK